LIRHVAFALWLTAAPLWAEVLPAFHAVTGVATDDVLNIRAAPDADAAILATLPPDATGIEVVAVEGDWAVLNSGEATGYVALRFLRREAGPDWNKLQVPLACSGTEPFWSLDIDPIAGEVRSQTPDDAAPRAEPLTVAWLGSPLAPDMAVALPDGLALLSPAECSDGMSDRRYGIAVQVFRTGVGYVDRESGCCRLAGL
jgi:uncharacterized membrane protein